jgi:hypothetical protein
VYIHGLCFQQARWTGIDMVAISKFALVMVVLLSCGLCLAVAVATRPLWAKEKPLYVGDFGARYDCGHDEFRMPDDATAQWRSEQVQTRAAVPSPSPPMACGVSSLRSNEQLKNAMRVRTLSLGQLDRYGKRGSTGAKSSFGDGRFHFPLNYYKIEAAPSNTR